MKKLILSAYLLGVMCVSAFADTVTQTVTVNGVEVTGKAVTQITFSGDNAVLTFSDNTTQKEDIGLISIAFDYTVDTSGIGSVSMFNFSGMVDGRLQLGGLEAGTAISLYNVTGKKLASATAADGSVSIDVSGLSRGVYIVKAGTKVVKFMKK